MIALVVVLAVIIVILAVSIFHNHVEARRQKREEEAAKARESASVPNTSIPKARVEVPFTSRSNPLPHFRECLKGHISHGQSFAEALLKAVEDSHGNVTIDDALAEAAEMDYSAKDVATFMASHEYSLEEIAAFVDKHYTIKIREFIDVLFPLVQGDSPKNKAGKVLSAIKEVWDIEGDEESFSDAFTALGCSKRDVLEIFCSETDSGLANVAVMFQCFDPTMLAELAKVLDVDLSETDEYKALRDDSDVDFAAAAKILKACGKTATEILNAENEYQSLSFDDVEEIISGLDGFTSADIVDAIADADFTSDESLGAIVNALYDKVHLDDIVNMLCAEDPDLDDFDNEMREAEMDIRDRVAVLNALFVALDNKKATEPIAPPDTVNSGI